MRYLIYIILSLVIVACNVTKPTIITPSETVHTILRDSVVYRDSIVIIPIERVVDVAPIYDTLKLSTTLATAVCWVDTTTHTLRGKLKNKEQTAKHRTTEVVYKELRDTVTLYQPEPYPVPTPYTPTWMWWITGLGFVCAVCVISRLFYGR